MSDAHTTEVYKGWTIEIHYDNDGCESPREWDNLGFMACRHRRSWLGDEPKKIQQYSPTEYIESLVSEFQPIPDVEDDKIWKLFSKYYAWLPIYAYEHGGITIRSGSFSDPWDSGQLGFIYVSKKKALEEWKQKNWTKAFEKKVLNILDGEIETYDQYLTGDVHGYMIYRPDDEELDESIDSCWGFYGTKDAMDEAKSMIDWHIENDAKQEKLLNSCMSL